MRHLSNIGIKTRIKQVLVLLIVIILGILISQALEAKGLIKPTNARRPVVESHSTN